MTKLCLLAGNLHEAETFASAQNLESDQWFFPLRESDIQFKTNFHVIVVGSAGQNLPPYFFEKIYALALRRGKIGRV